MLADHGEELGEHGSWGHGHTLYTEALDIPLIIAGPRVPVAVRNESVSTVDVAPTIAALAGLPWGRGPGVDLLQTVPDRVLLAETSRFDTARFSLESGNWRLDYDFANDRRELFDRGRDHREKHDLATAVPEVAANMSRDLLRALGTPYQLEGGSLTTSGWFVVDGAVIGQTLTGPARFAVFPVDATFTFPEGTLLRAPTVGLGLHWLGSERPVDVVLDAQTRAELQALGYVQE